MDNITEDNQNDSVKFTKSNDWIMFPSFKHPNHTFCLHLKTRVIKLAQTETLIENFMIPDSSFTEVKEEMDATTEEVWSFYNRYSLKLEGPKKAESIKNGPLEPLWWPYRFYIVFDFETISKFNFIKYLEGIKKSRFMIFLPYVVQLEIVRRSENETLSKNISKFLFNQANTKYKKRILELQSLNDSKPFEPKIDSILSICLLIKEQGGNVILATENDELLKKAEQYHNIKVINHKDLLCHINRF